MSPKTEKESSEAVHLQRLHDRGIDIASLQFERIQSWHEAITDAYKLGDPVVKINEDDKRPKRQFAIGDIVTSHPKRADLQMAGDGIIVELLPGDETMTRAGYQYVRVFFAAREVDLWAECRKIVRDMINDPLAKPEGIMCINSDLVWKKQSHAEWLEAPDAESVGLFRFSDILE